MTDKKDTPNKGKPSEATPVGGKKPHATLDLKATEIKASTSGSGPSGKASAGSTDKSEPAGKSAGASTPTGVGTSPNTGGSKPGSAAADTKPADKAASSGGKPSYAKASADAAKPAPKPASKPRSGSGIGSFLSHTVAGLIGGFLTLLGADAIQPQISELKSNLGLPATADQASAVTKELEDRLAALETARKADGSKPADGALAASLAETQAKIAELESLKSTVDELQASQGELAETANKLTEQIGETPAAGNIPEERIAKLEQQLATMSAFAESNQDSGSVPRVAALTGRMADLEATLKNQIAALRAGVNEDVETRLAQIAESSEAARSGTQRVDRQLAGVSTDTARLGQQMQTLKADTTRLGDTLRVVQEETAKITSKLDGLEGDVTSKIAKLASPADVEQAVKPVAEKITSLEGRVANVVSAEKDRKQNAKRIVLTLELANLERAIERGDSFAGELSQVKQTAGDLIDVSKLEQFGSDGVVPVSKLQSSFRPVAHQILEASAAPSGGSVFDQLMANARSVVKVRKVDHNDGDTGPEAVVARMESTLESGRLSDVLELAKSLPDNAQKAAAGWLKKVEDRHAVDLALRSIENQLKASLSGTN